MVQTIIVSGPLSGGQISGIEALLPAWHLALRTRAVIRQNFILALGYNLIALPLATLGLLTPLFAAVAMLSSSCLVTLNAMRVR